MRTTAVLLFALLVLLFDNSCAAPLDNQKDGKQGIMSGYGSPQYQFGGIPGSNYGGAGVAPQQAYLSSQGYSGSYFPGYSGSMGFPGSMGYAGGMGSPLSQGYIIGSGSYNGYPQTGFIPPYQFGNTQGGFPGMFRKKENTPKEEQHAKLRH